MILEMIFLKILYNFDEFYVFKTVSSKFSKDLNEI